MQSMQFITAGFGPNRRIFRRRVLARRRRVAIVVLAGVCLAAWAAAYGSAHGAF